MSTRAKNIVAFTLLAVALAAVRLVGLGDYPECHPDEGFWANGPRNFVRFGDPIMDGRLHPFLSPGHFVLLSAYFEMVPPDLFTARMFSVLAGLLTCLLVAVLGHKFFPGRPWLYLLLFGLSSMAVLIHRQILLEADQILWLTMAAALWLLPCRGQGLLAGVAFGIALLVKSNAIFLLPAFVITPPSRAREPGPSDTAGPRRWLTVAVFLVTCGLVGGGGYLATRAANPEAFADAFGFELRGQRYLDENILFHIERFGFNKKLSAESFRHLVLTEPWLLVLTGVWFVRLPWQFRRLTRADWFFAAWAALGLVFHFMQVYVSYRYLTTLVPALAWLAARTIEKWLERPPLPMRAAAVLVLVLFVCFHMARIGAGTARRPNANYWQAVAWIGGHVPADAKVIAAPYLGLSLPQQSYDFYRLTVPYDRSLPELPLAGVVAGYGIGYIVVEDEWRTYETADKKDFLATRCTILQRIGNVEVYQVR